MNRTTLLRLVTSVLLSLGAVSASGQASVFVTGHDPIWHAGLGGNAAGATNLAKTGIDYARNGSALPFLQITYLRPRKFIGLNGS